MPVAYSAKQNAGRLSNMPLAWNTLEYWLYNFSRTIRNLPYCKIFLPYGNYNFGNYKFTAWMPNMLQICQKA